MVEVKGCDLSKSPLRILKQILRAARSQIKTRVIVIIIWMHKIIDEFESH